MDLDRSDEQLMLDYAAGDVAAFESLYLRHRQSLFRHILRQVRQQSLAEDLFQDVWQKLISARLRYRVEAKFTTWLFQIASNRLADHWRAQAIRPTAPDDAEQRIDSIVEETSPEQTLSTFEQRRRLQIALECLPPDQREAILLRLEQSMSLEQIAEVTGVGLETAKSRLRYAMSKLKQQLKTSLAPSSSVGERDEQPQA